MKKYLFIILSAVAAKGMAQNAEFNSIHTNTFVKVVLSPAESSSVKVDGTEEDKAHIKTEIRDGKLVIVNSGKVSKDAKIQVNIKELKELIVTGQGDVHTEGQITGSTTDIKITGAGDAVLDIKAKNINAIVTGAGDLLLKGSADMLDAKVTGAGDLKAAELKTRTALVISTGAGDAKLNVSDTIDAKVSGAGDITFRGDPSGRNVVISGAGSVRQVGENEEEMEIDATIKGNDTTRIRWKGKKLIIIDDRDTVRKKGHHDHSEGHSHDHPKKKDSKPKKNKIWSGLELGVNGYFNTAGTLKEPYTHPYLELDYSKSHVFNFNFLEHSFRLHKNYVMLTTGLGTEFNRYAFRNNYMLVSGTDSLQAIPTTLNFQKNSLKTSYLTAPLMIQFNTNKRVKKSFHLAAGVVAGYNFNTHLKQVYEIEDTKVKSKVYDDFQVNPFKAAATVRLGYSNFNIFATYGLTPLFESGSAPDLYPFTLGVTLVGF